MNARRTVSWTGALGLLLFFSTGFSSGSCHGEDILTEDIRTKSQAILKRVNTYLSANELPLWNLDLSLGHVKLFEGSRTGKRLLWLHHRSEYSFEFHPSDYSLMSISNSRLRSAITTVDGRNFRVFDEPPPQKWSSDRATELAMEFVKACIGTLPGNLGGAKAEFSEWKNQDRGKPIRGYRVPEWSVVFPRIDEDGHEFENDKIQVEMFEDSGPYFILIDLHSTYERVDAKPLDESETFPLALARAREIGSPTVLERLLGGRADKIDPSPLSVYLRIVMPNGFGVNELTPQTEVSATPCRLAWVFWFERMDLERNGKGGLTIWIDAHTGEYLGGGLW